MNIQKKLLSCAWIFIGMIALPLQAMERTATASETTAAITTLDLFPPETWNAIANRLPGDNPFLNRLARHVNLDDSCYQKIVAALLYEIEDIPLLDEIPHFIDRYLKTTHLPAIDAKIANAFRSIKYNHKLGQYRPHARSIYALTSHLRYDRGFTLTPVALSVWQLELEPLIGESTAHFLNNRRLTQEQLQAKINKIKTSIMHIRYLQKLVHHWDTQATLSEKAVENLSHYFSYYVTIIGTGVIGLSIILYVSYSSRVSQYLDYNLLLIVSILCISGGVLANCYQWRSIRERLRL